MAESRGGEGKTFVRANQALCLDCMFDYRCKADGPPDCDGNPQRCKRSQAVETPGVHPAVYLGYCPYHYRERTVCRGRGCRNTKEPWAKLCESCSRAAETKREREIVSGLRAVGNLCPDCARKPRHVPQMWCEDCLRKRGINPLPHTDSPWAVLLRATWAEQRKADAPLDPVVAAQRVDAAALADRRARKVVYNKRWKVRFDQRKTPSTRPPYKPTPAQLVAAVIQSIDDPTPDERELMGLPPKRYDKPRPIPKPARGQQRWKRQYWTGHKRSKP